MIPIRINNVTFWVNETLSVLEACVITGFSIPKFCQSEYLSVAGSCRMCLIELTNVLKPVASCSLPIQENAQIFTNTPLVKKARENVLKTLLINHPLDCPICDNGSECDLQDLTSHFSSVIAGLLVKKKTISDKYLGPIINTIMTRCIHCTRCVRFNVEIAGTDFFGTLSRGKHMQISNYVNKASTSEILGNTIDLCPVGAITSKPYSFKARAWELKSIDSIDLNDSFGSNLYLHYKEKSLVRITPKVNKDINENWISDKARFSLDRDTPNLTVKLKYDKTHLREKMFESSSFLTRSLNHWIKLFAIYQEILLYNKYYGEGILERILFLIDEDIDFESLYYLKLFETLSKTKKYISNLRSIIFCTSLDQSNDQKLNYGIPSIRDKIIDIKKEIFDCFIFSSHIQTECTLLNLKLRCKALYRNKLNTYSFGLNYKSNYEMSFVNLSVKSIFNFLEGKLKLLSTKSISSYQILFLWGESFINRLSSSNCILFKELLKFICPTSINLAIKKKSNSSGLTFLNTNTITKKQIKDSDIRFCFNLEDSFLTRLILSNLTKKLFWINYNKLLFAKENSQNIIKEVPVLCNYDSQNIYFNLENRPQKTMPTSNKNKFRKALKIFVYKILLFLTFLDCTQHGTNSYTKCFLNLNFFFMNLETKYFKKKKEIIFINEIIKNFKLFSEVNLCFRLSSVNPTKPTFLTSINYPFKKICKDFYVMNTLTKNSDNMAEYSRSKKIVETF